MKRSLDSVLERPAKRHKSAAHRYHISDGPLKIIVSCLAQSEYAIWLCTHQNAKRFKFNGHTVRMVWSINVPAVFSDWWFHKRAATFAGVSDLNAPELQNWDTLHLDDADNYSSCELPDCRELHLTSPNCWTKIVSTATRRLFLDHQSWCGIPYESLADLEFMQLDGALYDVADAIRLHWPKPHKLKHLVLKFGYKITVPNVVTLPLAELELFEMHVPVGSRVSAGDARVRIFNFELKQ